MRAGDASVRIRIRDVGKSKAPARGVLRAQFFDDQGVGQGGQPCQAKNMRGFNIFLEFCLRWLASGRVASGNWIPWIPQGIQRAKIVIPQAFDNESLFPRSPGRWLPPGFPGESACR
jgi:hypothetical protein